jgi:anti-sigma regulatory factor (Ser/Thr protein kinase)
MVETAMAPRLLSSTYEPDPAVAGRIRHGVRTVLADWGVGEGAVDDAVLVVEELVANVVDHAHTRFELTVLLSDDVLRVAVRDRSDRPPRLRPVNTRALRGRGLQMVARLSRRWGCDPHRTGKTVWAELHPE